MQRKITHPQKVAELRILEELFYDQLTFKLSAILSILQLKGKDKEAMESFSQQLSELTLQNISLLSKRKL